MNTDTRTHPLNADIRLYCRISAAAPLALADQLPLPMIVKRGWSGFPV